jgi:DtxR family Mn-dependent transcriptional regulator
MTSALRDLSVRAVDCLKFIYKFDERDERVTTSAMRERLQALEPDGQLSDATVTQLFKSLAEKGYVEHVPYRGVTLTERGRLAAAELVRHHRLLELYLARAMNYSLDAVDAEAERLEHAISEEFEDRLDALLGHPTEDPHGDPIPSKSGEVVVAETRPLSELAAGQLATVRRVRDDDAALLRYLTTLGLVPGAEVCIREIAPFGGPLRVRVGDEADGAEHALGPQVAAGIRVAPR